MMMDKAFKTILFAVGLAVAVSSGIPAIAADGSNPAAAAAASSQASPSKVGSGAPVAKVAGAFVGTMIGIPCAAARAAKADWIRGVGEFTHQSKNSAVVGLVGTALVPVVALSGIIQSPWLATRNALKGQPFSKESFSLGAELE